MTIYSYFKFALGEPPQDESLKQLPVSSPCGADCQKVIEAGQKLFDVVDPAVQDEVRDAIESGVVVLWRG